MSIKLTYEELENQIAELKKQAANLHALINNHNESIWSVDSNYNFIAFNNFFEEAYFEAYNIKLRKGLNSLEILTPELLEFWKPKYDKALSGDTVVYEFTNQVEDVNRFYEVTLNPIIQDNKIKGVTGLSIDITKRKRAEEKLLLYKAIIDESTDGIAIIDKQGYYLEQNSAHRDLIGYSDEDLKGATPAIHFGADGFSSIAKELEENGFYRGELISDTKTGKLNIDISAFSIFNKAGEVTCHAAIKRDITDQKNAELEIIKAKEKAEESEKYLNNIINSIGDPVFVKDDQSRLLLVNDAFCTIFNLTRAEIIGKTLAEEVSREERESFLKIDIQVLSNGKENISEEMLTVRNGPMLTISTRKTRFIDDNDKNFLVGVIHDITENMNAQVTLRQRTQLLEVSQFIARVGGWELDLTTNDLFWTAETYRIHDTTPEEFNPTVDSAVGYFLPESRQILSTALQAAIERGEGYDLELETLTTKGRRIDVRTTCEVTLHEGRPAKLTGIFQDITDQKQAEEALRESDANLKAIIEIPLRAFGQ